MKKFLALVLAMVLCIGMLFLTSCGENSNTEGNESEYVFGNYHYESFRAVTKYLKFLSSFNYTENEILYVNRSSGVFWITWRVKDTSEKNIQTVQTSISVSEILQNNENYIVIANDDTITMIPKNTAEFVISNENNLLILEKDDSTITKATFCITKEMLESIE